MVTSTSPLAYTDCYEVMDRALAKESGAIRIRFTTEGDARHFRTRLHSARQINRKENAATYEEGKPMHGRSEYDQLIVKMRSNGNGEWYLLIEKIAKPLEIEDID